MVFRNKFSIDVNAFNECYQHIPRFKWAGIINRVCKAAVMDGIDPNTMDENDKLFKPSTKWEKLFWEACRKLSKKEVEKNGLIFKKRVV